MSHGLDGLDDETEIVGETGVSGRQAARASMIHSGGIPCTRAGFSDQLRVEWAVELFRRGDDKGEHFARVLKDGNYYPLAPSHWRTVDFRPASSRPTGRLS